MAIAFKCTSCGRGLRANPEMVGKRTKCPGCATVLTIPAADADEAAPAPKSAAVKTSPAAPAAVGAILACEACGTKVRAKPEWAGKAIKCPKCQGRIQVPGVASAAPSPIKAAAKRPAPPPVEDDLDEDDRPDLGGDASDDDDEPDARPARAKAAPAKKKSSMRLLIALLVLILVAGGGFAAWVFFFDDSGGPIPANKKFALRPEDDKDDGSEKPIAKLTAAGNPFDNIPSDAIGFFDIKPQSFLKSAIGQKLLAEAMENSEFGKINKQITDAFGVGINDVVDAIWVIRSVAADDINQDFPLTMISTTAPINPEGFGAEIDKLVFEKKESNGIGYYAIVPRQDKLNGQRRDGPALIQTGTNVVIVGHELAILKFIAGGSPKTGPLSPHLKSARVGKHLMYAGFQLPAELAEMAKKMAPPQAASFLSLLDAKTGHITISEEEGLKLFAKLTFEDAAKAEEARKAVDAAMALARLMLPMALKMAPPEIAKNVNPNEDPFKALKPTVVGNSLELSLTQNVTLDQIGELLGPVIQQMRGTAQKAQGANNLKQVALAMLNYHAVNGRLPDAKVGAGLSWRVAVLPFLEQENLFKQIKADEPWDSDHNKQFLQAMPKVFEHPTRRAPPGHTYFRVFVGPKTLFEQGKPGKLDNVLDGSSNTFLIVEAEAAVPWTKPDELVFDPASPLPKLGDPTKNVTFSAAMADGSVRDFREVDEATLRALITASGGEPLDLSKVK